MALTPAQLEIARRIAHEVPDMDSTLPNWAKRTNPLIRRHLKDGWRVFPPELDTILKWFILQMVILLVSLVFDLVYVYLMMLVLVSALFFPFMLYIYGRVLLTILSDSAHLMADEYENDTLTLLRTTPLTTREIVLSKISATVWGHMDDLALTIFFTLIFGTPMIALFYLLEYPPSQQPGISQIASILVLAASIIRLPLEMFMIGALGVMMGAAARIKRNALLGTAVLCLFYFLLLNLARLIPLAWYWQVFVDAALPIILPLVIIWGAVQATVYLITRD
ncbi:MAG: hypothetical protein CUN56_13310 [Phototrophicales bacterium]|nr:MAG: hypothetical protein CUN56_13310 [Phototrophicales bacterium]RMG76982.1 MAG: hypothetical protein D6711_02670 [Chloroflexota bacterium]